MLLQLRRHCPALPLLAIWWGCAQGPGPSTRARAIADHAAASYFDSTLATLADLVAFQTVHDPDVENARNPQFRAMTEYLRLKAEGLGLDFSDHGAVVVVGLGNSAERLGVITHGDVQPADPSKWARDPFSLDTLSEPGRLVGRGVEDDKGPIATALYAMKALKDHNLPRGRRIELVISYTEESEWSPFQEFLANWQAPAINVAIDAEYPVVVAEKGWGAIFLAVPPLAADRQGTPRMGADPQLRSFSGGAFLSQIPEDAEAVIESPTPELEERLAARAATRSAVSFSFETRPGSLLVRARGVSAHSSKPWDGKNAITHLAALLGDWPWPDGQAARMVRLINDLVGTGDYAEKFGDVAYSDDFMGPLTLSLTTLGYQNDTLNAGINIRRPVGRSSEAVDQSIREAVEAWKSETGLSAPELSMLMSDPYHVEEAPHIPVLLKIFRHYSGDQEAAAISMGGGTHARLLPNGVNFGPSMPGEPYTGHSEQEYMSREQYLLNLKMYTAMLVELAGG